MSFERMNLRLTIIDNYLRYPNYQKNFILINLNSRQNEKPYDFKPMFGDLSPICPGSGSQ